MSDPGLMASGSLIHRCRFSGVLVAAPDARVSRLIRCVRSGPNLPLAFVPATVWQLTHAVDSKMRRPCATESNSAAGCFWLATHLLKSSRDSTTTRSSILACCTPQYCAHWPTYTPVSCGSIHMLLTRLGMRSVFPASCGTQKLWLVSADISVICVGVG